MTLLALWGFDDTTGEPGAVPNSFAAGRNGVGHSGTYSYISNVLSFGTLFSAGEVGIFGAAVNATSDCSFAIVDSNGVLAVTFTPNGVAGTMQVGNYNGFVGQPFNFQPYWNNFTYMTFVCQLTVNGFADVYIENVLAQHIPGNFSINNNGILGGFRQVGVPGNVTLDDAYLANTLGPAPFNAPLGDVFVRTLSPSGNGTNSQWTNSAGNQTDNYSYVDETPSSMTDFVSANATGLADSYANPGVGALVPLAVQPIAYGNINTAGSAPAVSLTLTESAVTVSDPLGPFTTSAVNWNGTVHETTPSGGTWTEADLVATQIGIST